MHDVFVQIEGLDEVAGALVDCAGEVDDEFVEIWVFLADGEFCHPVVEGLERLFVEES